MSIFGKILAIFVFLLSLVWFFLTVNLYATRAEWKKAYDAASKAAATNAKDTEELKKQIQLERANIDAREQAAKLTVQAVAKQRDETQKNYDDLKVDQGKLAQKVEELKPTLAAYDAGIKKVQAQVDALTDENKKVTTARDEYAKQKQDAENKMTKAQLEASTLEKARAELIDIIQKLQDRRTVAAGGGSFRGEVQQVSADGSTISFSGGLNAGVTKNKEYRVVRDKAPYFIGTVTVTVTDTQSSAGSFNPAKGTATGDYLPKAGDIVESK